MIPRQGPGWTKAWKVEWRWVGRTGWGFWGQFMQGPLGLAMDFVGSHRWSEQGGTWSGVGSRKLTLAAVARGPHVGVMANPWEGLEATGLRAGMCHAGAQWIGVPGELRATLRPIAAMAACPGRSCSSPPSHCSEEGTWWPLSSASSCTMASCGLPCRRQPCGEPQGIPPAPPCCPMGTSHPDV